MIIIMLLARFTLIGLCELLLLLEWTDFKGIYCLLHLLYIIVENSYFKTKILRTVIEFLTY